MLTLFYIKRDIIGYKAHSKIQSATKVQKPNHKHKHKHEVPYTLQASAHVAHKRQVKV